MNGLLCYCRAGFEPELAGELTERAAEAGFAGYARTERGSGLVVFACDEADALSAALPFDALIFARQKLRLLAELRGLDPNENCVTIAINGSEVVRKMDVAATAGMLSAGDVTSDAPLSRGRFSGSEGMGPEAKPMIR